MKRVKTKYTGVYEQISPIRMHLGKSDVCYYITYARNGKFIWEKVGWKSEGYNAKLASNIRAERMRSIRHGEELPQDRKQIPFFKDAAKRYLLWAKDNKARQGLSQQSLYKNHLMMISWPSQAL